MKFFHYTQSRRLESILEEGLRPVDEEGKNYSSFDFWDAAAPDGVVWLIAEPINPHGCHDVVADVRITLELQKEPAASSLEAVDQEAHAREVRGA
jgi:hypothetical protein